MGTEKTKQLKPGDKKKKALMANHLLKQCVMIACTLSHTLRAILHPLRLAGPLLGSVGHPTLSGLQFPQGLRLQTGRRLGSHVSKPRAGPFV